MRDDEAGPPVQPAEEPSEPARPPLDWAVDNLTAVQEPERPRSTASRVLEAVAWVVGVLAVLFFGRIYAVWSGSRTLTPYQWGEVTGTIFGAIIIGILVRWVVVKLRHRGRVRSPWILLIAAVFLLLNLGRQPALGSPPPADVPIGTYLEIAAPYSLGAAAPEDVEQFRSLLASGGTGESEIRVVTEGGEAVGYFVVKNFGTGSSEEFLRGLERGIEEAGAVDAETVPIGGKSAVVGSGEGFAVVFWTEPPYGLIVYATDVESGKILATAIIDGYQ